MVTRLIILAVFVRGVSLAAVDGTAAPAAKPPITVADSIEVRRTLSLLENYFHDAAYTPICVSPSGRRYVVPLLRGDLRRDGNWVEFVTGELDNLAMARGRIAARLFTISRKDDNTGMLSPTHPAWNKIQWLDHERQIAFLWNDGTAPTQAVALDLASGKVTALTRHPTSVLRFHVDDRGTRVFYAAFPPVSAANRAEMLRRGFAIAPSADFLSLIEGKIDGEPWSQLQLFVADAPGRTPRRIAVEGVVSYINLPWPGGFSADGRYAVYPLGISQARPGWERYPAPGFQRQLRELADGRRPLLSQTGIVDLEHTLAKPLWSAPDGGGGGVPFLWSPRGEELLMGPTFLPLETADAAGRAGTAVAVVNALTGDYRALPLPRGAVPTLEGAKWRSQDEIELADGAGKKWQFVRQGKIWAFSGEEDAIPPPGAPVRVELRQDYNTAPKYVATDRVSGREEIALDVAPELANFLMGEVRPIHWRDGEGRPWTGKLYLPVNFDPNRHYPVVVTLNPDFPQSEFSLTGQESLTTAFAAQPMAGRGMAILMIGNGPDGRQIVPFMSTPLEAEIVMAGCESGIEYLVRSGIADRQKIGLVGFSRTGWRAEYVLTHSRIQVAAALVADNIDSSYIQAMIVSKHRADFERENGGSASGDGLQKWLLTAPGFNADKIHAPLRMEIDTGGVSSLVFAWEVFSQLRYLHRPAELYLIGDSIHADHPVQIPSQKFASQQGSVDWFDFWLNGHERADPAIAAGETKESLAEQYARWRKLRELRDADLKTTPAKGALPEDK